MVLLGTEDARFGFAAGDPWIGVSGTKTAENSVERHFGVKGLVEFGRTRFKNSYNVGNKRSAVFVPICFTVPWGDLFHAVENVNFLDVGLHFKRL